MTIKKHLSLLLLLFASISFSAGWAGQRVYLMAGQSNMMGLANTSQLPAGYRHTPANVTFIYQGRQRPLARDSRFGPEVSFAHLVSRAFPDDEHIIIKFAATGSHIRQWLPGEHYYRAMLRQINISFDRTPRIDAVFWMQGESDARNSYRATRYANRLSRFIHSLRRDLRSPSSLFIMGQINPQGSGYPMVQEVQLNQRVVDTQVNNTLLITTHGLHKNIDNIHYSAQGQLELGRRFAATYIHSNRALQPIRRNLRSEILALFR